MAQSGLTNTITDVAGIRVGHATRHGNGWLTGTTVVLPPPTGAVAGVDVRGGGPGTRETDALDPRANVSAVHAVVLTGGSAFGLAAADGVMRALFDAGVGYVVGLPPKATIVPIVPAAVIFDLGRGDDSSVNRPDASFLVSRHSRQRPTELCRWESSVPGRVRSLVASRAASGRRRSCSTTARRSAHWSS